MRLEEWNGMSADAAAREILPCNGSRGWARGMAALRPFVDASQMFAGADAVWWALEERDWQEAFDSHPRIGEREAQAATDQSLEWSEGEQAAARLEEGVKAELAEANREYERRFGRIFIVCATGKSAEEMLGILRGRLGNDAAAELREAAEQQRLITQIRVRKWLGMG